MQMVEQTRKAIEALEAAGFKRVEFEIGAPSSTSPDERQGVEITLRASKARKIKAIPALVRRGVSVTRYVDYDGTEYAPDFHLDTGTEAVVETVQFADDYTTLSTTKVSASEFLASLEGGDEEEEAAAS